MTTYQLRVPMAKRIEDSSLIKPEEAKSAIPYLCAECNAEVRYRRGHVRTSGSVQPHFYHVGEVDPNRCSYAEGESETHRLAKAKIIAQIEAWEGFGYTQRCPSCHFSRPFEAIAPYSLLHATPEYRVSPYRVDVAILAETNEPVLLVEVYHCHRVPEDKRRALNATGIPWVELTALSILNGSPEAVEEATSAKMCHWCLEKEEENKQKAEVARKAEEERIDKLLARYQRAATADSLAASFYGLDKIDEFLDEYIKWLVVQTGAVFCTRGTPGNVHYGSGYIVLPEIPPAPDFTRYYDTVKRSADIWHYIENRKKQYPGKGAYCDTYKASQKHHEKTLKTLELALHQYQKKRDKGLIEKNEKAAIEESIDINAFFQ